MMTPGCQVCPGRPQLVVSQPDEADYVRLVAICPECGRWYLRLEPDGGHPMTSPLPVPTLEELGVELESVPA